MSDPVLQRMVFLTQGPLGMFREQALIQTVLALVRDRQRLTDEFSHRLMTAPAPVLAFDPREVVGVIARLGKRIGGHGYCWCEYGFPPSLRSDPTMTSHAPACLEARALLAQLEAFGK